MKNILKASAFVILYLSVYFIITNHIQFVMIIVFFIRDIIADPGLLEAFSLKSDMYSYAESYLKYALYVQIAAAIISFFIYLFITRLRKQNIFKVCSFRDTETANLVISSILGISLVLPVSLLMNLVPFKDISIKTQESINSIVEGNSIFVVILALGIIAPFIEELIFRGLIFSELKRIMPIPAVILVQAFLFAIYHGNLYQTIYAFFLGIVLGYVLYKTGSIVAPILIHIFYNTSNILIEKVFSEYLTEQQATTLSAMILFSSFVFIIFAFFALHYLNKKDTVDVLDNTTDLYN